MSNDRKNTITFHVGHSRTKRIQKMDQQVLMLEGAMGELRKGRSGCRDLTEKWAQPQEHRDANLGEKKETICGWWDCVGSSRLNKSHMQGGEIRKLDRGFDKRNRGRRWGTNFVYHNTKVLAVRDIKLVRRT